VNYRVIDELAQAFSTEPNAGSIEGFVRTLRKRLQHLGVCLVDGQVIGKSEASALAAQVIDLVRGPVLGALGERPGDALRVLDALRSTGYTELEGERAGFERACATRFPPPPAATWPEIGLLHALAASDPGLCRLGAPALHVEFAVRLGDAGTEVPRELLALYAAASHVTLTCRHVVAPAGSICAGDALRVRDGRLVLFDRIKRHPMMQFVEQPGVSIARALGTWWLVLEDDRAPATRRPLDLQGFLRFSLRRLEAPTLEALLTDLAWRRFFV
jgi:hypothetical protein